METYLNSVNLKADTDFPLIVADGDRNHMSPRTPGFHVFHHHVDFQFLLVEKGDLLVKTLDKEVSIHEGQWIFINSDVVHLVLHGPTCHNKSFIFPKEMVSFYAGSPCEAQVASFISSAPSIYVSTSQQSWCTTVKELLSTLAHIYETEKDSPYYAYHLLTNLSFLWFQFSSHVESSPQVVQTENTRRMELFLSHIEAHYAEPLTLTDIANSASVSPSECLRCFKALMHTTPHQYLIEYRLSRAAKLLKETDLPITDIAFSVGFHQISHFGAWFKKKLGISPRDYRKSTQSKQ